MKFEEVKRILSEEHIEFVGEESRIEDVIRDLLHTGWNPRQVVEYLKTLIPFNRK